MARNKVGVYKDGSRWRVQTTITINGERIQISKRGFKTQNDAFIFREQALFKILNDSHIPGFVSVSKALEMFFEFKSKSLKNNSVYHFKMRLLKHTSEIKDKSIKNIVTYRALMDYKDYIISLNVTSRYKNRMITIYKEFLTFSYNRGLIDLEDFKNVNLVLVAINQSDEKKEQPTWSKRQYQFFLDSMPKKSIELVLFTLWGQIGARISEIRALQVKHFNYQNKSIKIEQQANSRLGIGKTIITSPKTSKSNRIIQLSDGVCDLLLDYINGLDLNNESFLFSSSRNLPMSENTIRRLLNKYAVLANLPHLNPHGIRHSNTTWLLTGILNLDEIGAVSERLGHSSKTTTLNIYFHVNKASNRNLSKIVDFK